MRRYTRKLFVTLDGFLVFSLKTFQLGQFVPEDAHKVGGPFRIQMIGVGEILQILPKTLIKRIIIINDTCVRCNIVDCRSEFLQELL